MNYCVVQQINQTNINKENKPTSWKFTLAFKLSIIFVNIDIIHNEEHTESNGKPAWYYQGHLYPRT